MLLLGVMALESLQIFSFMNVLL